MIRRSWMTVAAAALMTTALLSACGRESDAEDDDAVAAEISDGPATGEVTIWAQGTEGEALQDFLAPFEAENPDVDITVTAVPWDSAQNKYQTAVAGGTTPDIGMLGTDWMPTFREALQPTPEGIDTSGMFPFSVGTTDLGGTHYGVPWYVETRLIFYRVDLMQAAGFDTFPTDWEGLRELARAYQANGAEYAISLPSGGWNSFLSILPFVWSNNGEVMNAEQTEWTFDTPEMAGALEFVAGFFTEGLANPNPDTETGSVASRFVDGSVPMFLSGPWDVPGLLTAGGPEFADKFAVARIPAAPGGTSTSFAAGANLVVFDNAENADAAWKVIQWLSQPEVQVEWFRTVNDLPAQQAAWEDSALTQDPKVSVFGEQLENVKTPPALTAWPEVSAAADTQLEQVVRGGKDPATALAELQATADSLGTGE
ncbi:extracellular solute-binding protein [Jiangella aurantiaca]|uniref:Extracellular solute-binding protein n=1 Tax=Jiangella aurantiaca TaxID=2530373 RepID=A0A4R5AJ29_9ACTN|nr:extracellular solute-binding protein [Jiangella aurantiaca]TDD72561.1 extracellular solute-binding protein [Jiangella aurantiaca]